MDGVVDVAKMVGNRFTTNVQSGLANMSPEKWIRLVIIAGAYMLLRPYIIKLGAKAQMKAHEKEEAEAEEAAKAQISPNELRGQAVKIPEDSDDEDDYATAEATGPDWGKKARRRQRTMIKKLLEAEERRLEESKEEEEDKDIEEFLIKE
ncbi:protein trafficking Pga2 [Apodospora peruviana]|uniref:Protein trafficking Pga2 n=1 Tax=Apodospora peruviana TaxID=516989 RepID=A0AAE0IIT9_9PEZI|nr:protein trafficking Pga2 [Apodospora peruviana]